MYFHVRFPSFPAATTTIIPFSEAICAPLAINEVVPFI